MELQLRKRERICGSSKDLWRHRTSYLSVCLYMRVSHVAMATSNSRTAYFSFTSVLWVLKPGNCVKHERCSLYAYLLWFQLVSKWIYGDFSQFEFPPDVLRHRQSTSVPLWQTNLCPDEERRGWGSEGWVKGCVSEVTSVLWWGGCSGYQLFFCFKPTVAAMLTDETGWF